MRFPGFEGEWKEKRIGELLVIGSGKDYKHLQTGDIPVFGTGGYMTSVNKYLHDGETICIGRKGTINKPFYYNGKIWTVDTLFYTHSFKNLIPRFCFNLFEKINWLHFNEASGVPSLSKSTIENIEVNIPEESEQKKIAAFLKKIEERIETQNKIIEELKLLKSTLCDQLLEAHKGLLFKISDIANIGRGRVISSREISNQKNPLYPVYSSQTSNNGIMGYLDEFDFEGEYITWTTDGANAGTVFHRNGKFNCTNVCGVLKIKDTKLFNPGFVALALQRQTKKYVSTNLANPKLMNNVMSGITLNLPQIEIQNKISKLNQGIDAKIMNELKLMTNLLIQKKYLLDKLFK